MSAQPEPLPLWDTNTAILDNEILTVLLPAPIARTSDPEPSQQAAALVQGSRAASENWVVGVISKLGPCTDLDIAVVAEHQHVPWSPSRLRTARKEACDHGRVAAHDTVKPAGRRFAMTRWAVLS